MGYCNTMNFETDITAPVLPNTDCDASIDKALSIIPANGADSMEALCPDLTGMSAPAQAALHVAALVLLPVYLPVIAVWAMVSTLGRFGEALWLSAAHLYQDDGRLASVEAYVFKPSDLYSGLNLATLSQTDVPQPKQAAFNHISAMVYLFRPKCMERPLRGLIERPTILMEFFARTSLSRIVIYQLGQVPCGLRDIWLSMIAALWGRNAIFHLSSGLSPEPAVPE